MTFEVGALTILLFPLKDMEEEVERRSNSCLDQSISHATEYNRSC